MDKAPAARTTSFLSLLNLQEWTLDPSPLTAPELEDGEAFLSLELGLTDPMVEPWNFSAEGLGLREQPSVQVHGSDVRPGRDTFSSRATHSLRGLQCEISLQWVVIGPRRWGAESGGRVSRGGRLGLL